MPKIASACVRPPKYVRLLRWFPPGVAVLLRALASGKIFLVGL